MCAVWWCLQLIFAAAVICQAGLPVEAQSVNSLGRSSSGRRFESLQDILPLVSFKCKNRVPGYYADPRFECEVFHYCHEDGSRVTIFCPRSPTPERKHRICLLQDAVSKECGQNEIYLALPEDLDKSKDTTVSAAFNRATDFKLPRVISSPTESADSNQSTTPLTPSRAARQERISFRPSIETKNQQEETDSAESRKGDVEVFRGPSKDPASVANPYYIEAPKSNKKYAVSPSIYGRGFQGELKKELDGAPSRSSSRAEKNNVQVLKSVFPAKRKPSSNTKKAEDSGDDGEGVSVDNPFFIPKPNSQELTDRILYLLEVYNQSLKDAKPEDYSSYKRKAKTKLAVSSIVSENNARDQPRRRRKRMVIKEVTARRPYAVFYAKVPNSPPQPSGSLAVQHDPERSPPQPQSQTIELSLDPSAVPLNVPTIPIAIRVPKKKRQNQEEPNSVGNMKPRVIYDTAGGLRPSNHGRLDHPDGPEVSEQRNVYYYSPNEEIAIVNQGIPQSDDPSYRNDPRITGYVVNGNSGQSNPLQSIIRLQPQRASDLPGLARPSEPANDQPNTQVQQQQQQQNQGPHQTLGQQVGTGRSVPQFPPPEFTSGLSGPSSFFFNPPQDFLQGGFPSFGSPFTNTGIFPNIANQQRPTQQVEQNQNNNGPQAPMTPTEQRRPSSSPSGPRQQQQQPTNNQSPRFPGVAQNGAQSFGFPPQNGFPNSFFQGFPPMPDFAIQLLQPQSNRFELNPPQQQQQQQQLRPFSPPPQNAPPSLGAHQLPQQPNNQLVASPQLQQAIPQSQTSSFNNNNIAGVPSQNNGRGRQNRRQRPRTTAQPDVYPPSSYTPSQSSSGRRQRPTQNNHRNPPENRQRPSVEPQRTPRVSTSPPYASRPPSSTTNGWRPRQSPTRVFTENVPGRQPPNVRGPPNEYSQSSRRPNTQQGSHRDYVNVTPTSQSYRTRGRQRGPQNAPIRSSPPPSSAPPRNQQQRPSAYPQNERPSSYNEDTRNRYYGPTNNGNAHLPNEHGDRNNAVRGNLVVNAPVNAYQNLVRDNMNYRPDLFVTAPSLPPIRHDDRTRYNSAGQGRPDSYSTEVYIVTPPPSIRQDDRTRYNSAGQSRPDSYTTELYIVTAPPSVRHEDRTRYNSAGHGRPSSYGVTAPPSHGHPDSHTTEVYPQPPTREHSAPNVDDYRTRNRPANENHVNVVSVVDGYTSRPHAAPTRPERRPSAVDSSRERSSSRYSTSSPSVLANQEGEELLYGTRSPLKDSTSSHRSSSSSDRSRHRDSKEQDDDKSQYRDSRERGDRSRYRTGKENTDNDRRSRYRDSSESDGRNRNRGSQAEDTSRYRDSAEQGGRSRYNSRENESGGRNRNSQENDSSRHRNGRGREGSRYVDSLERDGRSGFEDSKERDDAKRHSNSQENDERNRYRIGDERGGTSRQSKESKDRSSKERGDSRYSESAEFTSPPPTTPKPTPKLKPPPPRPTFPSFPTFPPPPPPPPPRKRPAATTTTTTITPEEITSTAEIPPTKEVDVAVPKARSKVRWNSRPRVSYADTAVESSSSRSQLDDGEQDFTTVRPAKPRNKKRTRVRQRRPKSTTTQSSTDVDSQESVSSYADKQSADNKLSRKPYTTRRSSTTSTPRVLTTAATTTTEASSTEEFGNRIKLFGRSRARKPSSFTSRASTTASPEIYEDYTESTFKKTTRRTRRPYKKRRFRQKASTTTELPGTTELISRSDRDTESLWYRNPEEIRATTATDTYARFEAATEPYNDFIASTFTESQYESSTESLDSLHEQNNRVELARTRKPSAGRSRLLNFGKPRLKPTAAAA